MERIFYTTHDNGDGSTGVSFYESQECIKLLEEAIPDMYASGEGGSSFEVDGMIYGIHVYTLEDVKEEIKANECW